MNSSMPPSPTSKSFDRQSRTPLNSASNTPVRALSVTRKSKLPPDSNRQTTTNHRPTIFQRLFGLRSSSNPPSRPAVTESSLSSPLTVTLDSRDDLMPLTTSSTASSASGRASSSGYESMSNTALEDLMTSIPTMINNENNPIKLRNKSLRKGLNLKEYYLDKNFISKIKIHFQSYS